MHEKPEQNKQPEQHAHLAPPHTPPKPDASVPAEPAPRQKKGIAWEALPPMQQKALAMLGALQFALLAAALVDLYWRPAEQIRGPRWFWVLAVFVNFIGPVAYFTYGCKLAKR
jgi:hypothetical protein